jgi:hypothetical protein
MSGIFCSILKQSRPQNRQVRTKKKSKRRKKTKKKKKRKVSMLNNSVAAVDKVVSKSNRSDFLLQLLNAMGMERLENDVIVHNGVCEETVMEVRGAQRGKRKKGNKIIPSAPRIPSAGETNARTQFL